MLRLVTCHELASRRPLTTLSGVPYILGRLWWHRFFLIIGSQCKIKGHRLYINDTYFNFADSKMMSGKNNIFCYSPNSSDSLMSSFESSECYFRHDVPLYPDIESRTYTVDRCITKEPCAYMDEPSPQPRHSVAQSNLPVRQSKSSFLER